MWSHLDVKEGQPCCELLVRHPLRRGQLTMGGPAEWWIQYCADSSETQPQVWFRDSPRPS